MHFLIHTKVPFGELATHGTWLCTLGQLNYFLLK